MRALVTTSLLLTLALGGCGSSSESSTAPAASSSSGSEAASADIVDTAVGAGSFTTLVAAVQAAGLEETLRGAGPFTVFAPTDAAFAALPAGTLDSLLLPENREQLRSILTYHVVSGRVMASEAAAMSSAPTVQGASAPIAPVEGGLTIGGARIVTTDIACSNGVIHVIDAVMMPPAN
jgi:uncharacterized surface protein with fasciclin (FAS1) repeats